MAKRNPETTARNKAIEALSEQLGELLPGVLAETQLNSEQSLHGLYGGKFADYIDIKNEVIHSPDHFVSLYLEGFERMALTCSPTSAHPQNWALLRGSPRLQEYLYIFLRRTYLRNYEALSKKRPSVDEAAVWIGQNNAEYGLLVTPRFNEQSGDWENDKSEIRHFDHGYWTIGHVLETGLVIPGRIDRMRFSSVREYLTFFANVLVRNSGSKYELAIADIYCDFVLSSASPAHIPLLIPEFRYGGKAKAHKYRLDFTIIDPTELSKVGFELSPWSSHGYLAKTKSLSQAEINAIAKGNFEQEMRKHKDYFRKHGIVVLIYTDTDLGDLASVFEDMKRFLKPKGTRPELRFRLIRDILGVR